MRLLTLTGLIIVLAVVAGAQPHGVLISTDFNSAGSAGLMALESPWSISADLASVHSDAVGRWHDGLVYVVNRAGGDNIQILDPGDDLSLVRQFSLGLGRNIQDIAFLDDGTAYVSCYDTAELLHIDPANGAILHVISTASFADSDGLPETKWLHRVGGRLFLTCERLDRDNWYSPVGDSYLLVLDTATRAWVDCDPGQGGVQGIQLAATNPYSDIQRAGDHFLVGCSGFYAVQDGGVDVIDIDALASLGLEITEDSLGGDIVDVALGPDGRRYAIVADGSFVTSIKTYGAGAGVVLVHQGSAYDHADIAWDGDFQLFVADRRLGAAGVRVFDAGSGAQLTSGPIATGLPPAFFILPADDAVAVADLPAAGLSLAAPWPNPANPGTTIAFSAAPGEVVSLRLVDLRGRLVRRESAVADASGAGTWFFDGRDDRGRSVASGVYRCVAESGAGFAARSLTIVR